MLVGENVVATWPGSVAWIVKGVLRKRLQPDSISRSPHWREYDRGAERESKRETERMKEMKPEPGYNIDRAKGDENRQERRKE